MADPPGTGAAGLLAGSAPAANSPSPEAVRAQLGRVLRSPGFSHAPRRQQFLTFVVEEVLAGRGETLKEFVVAAEVFGRRDTYDPPVDATVRVEARRVREHLDSYHAGDGAADPVRIVLPVGTYVPRWFTADSGGTAKQAPPASAADAGGREAASGGGSVSSSASWPWQFVALVALLVGLAGVAMWWLAGPHQPDTSSLVVLPFAVQDEDVGSIHLANGLFDDLTSELGRAEHLTVIGRRSAAELRQRGLEPIEIGRELKVRAVLDGTVRRVNGRVRITARLIDTATGRQSWAESYDRLWPDVPGVQREVAEAVAEALAGHLGGMQPQAMRRQTSNVEAWEAYLEGRYRRDQRTQASLWACVPLFEKAVDLDPEYASAWAALGEALTTLAFHGLVPKGDAVQRARTALDRAIALSPDLAQAHGARAWLALVHDWRWREAELSFRRALSLDPGHAQTRQMYAFGLASRRRFDEALAESRRAMALDPRAYAASPDLAVLLLYARRYDEALERAREALRLDPASSVIHVVAGSALLGLRRPEAAIEEFRLGMESAAFSNVLGRLGYAFAVAGRIAEARDTLRRIDTASGDPSTSPIDQAYVYAGLGDRSAAISALRRAVDARDGEVVFLDVQPLLDGLRADPEFNALRIRVGLDRD